MRDEIGKSSIMELYTTMKADALNAREPFRNDQWSPTEKIKPYIENMTPQQIVDVPSLNINSHYSMRPSSSDVYNIYYKNLVDSIYKVKQYQSLREGILTDKPNTPAWKKSVMSLYDLCCTLPHADTVTQIDAYPTTDSFKYKGVLLTWDHVLSMWSVLSIIGCAPHILSERTTVLDLGSGWGRMGYILKKANPLICYVACDLPESLVVSSNYLPKTLPGEKIHSYMDNRDLDTIDKDTLLATGDDNPGVWFIGAHDIPKIESKAIDIVINIHSLAEMSPASIGLYHKEIHRISTSFYTLNRRYFDYQHGTGYFRDAVDDQKFIFRGTACCVELKTENGKTTFKRQWPDWPRPFHLLRMDRVPWDDNFFEEFMFLPDLTVIAEGEGMPVACPISPRKSRTALFHHARTILYYKVPIPLTKEGQTHSLAKFLRSKGYNTHAAEI